MRPSLRGHRRSGCQRRRDKDHPETLEPGKFEGRVLERGVPEIQGRGAMVRGGC